MSYDEEELSSGFKAEGDEGEPLDMENLPPEDLDFGVADEDPEDKYH